MWINWSCLLVGLGWSYLFCFEAAWGKQIGILRLFWDLGFLVLGFFWGLVLLLEGFGLAGALVTGDGSRAGALGSGRAGITFRDPGMHGGKLNTNHKK